MDANNISLILRITKLCNQSCNYCFLKDLNSNNLMSFQEIQQTVEAEILKNEEASRYTTLTGGEACTHPEFDAIVKYLYDRNFTIGIQTNATRELFEKRANTYDLIDHYLISIPTLNPDTFLKVSGNNNKEAIPTLLENLKFLSERNKRITTNTIIDNKETQADLVETLAKLKSFKISAYSLSALTPTQSCSQKIIDWRLVDFKKLADLVVDIGYPVYFDGFAPCITPPQFRPSVEKKLMEHKSIEKAQQALKSRPALTCVQDAVSLDPCVTCKYLLNNICTGYSRFQLNSFGEKSFQSCILKVS